MLEVKTFLSSRYVVIYFFSYQSKIAYETKGHIG